MKNIITQYSEIRTFFNDYYEKNILEGTYKLGRNIYVNVETYITKLRSEALFEVHKKFVDIHFIIEGREIITIADLKNMTTEKIPYNDGTDITFYANNLSGVDYIIGKDEWLIIKPGMAHMPCICVNAQSIVKKAVFKIPVEIWKN